MLVNDKSNALKKDVRIPCNNAKISVTTIILTQSFFVGLTISIIFSEPGFLPIVNWIRFSITLRNKKTKNEANISILSLKI